jgi:hypothetical protein
MVATIGGGGLAGAGSLGGGSPRATLAPLRRGRVGITLARHADYDPHSANPLGDNGGIVDGAFEIPLRVGGRSVPFSHMLAMGIGDIVTIAISG